MSFQFDWILVPLLASTAFCAGTGIVVAIQAFRNDSERTLNAANKLQSVVLLCLSGWTFGQVLAVTGTTLPPKLAGMYLTLVSALWASSTWLLFALLYTGRERLVTRPVVLGLYGGALAASVLTLTDTLHGRILVEPTVVQSGSEWVLLFDWGPATWVVAVYCWVVGGLAIWLLFRKFLSSRNVYRKIAFFHVAGGTVLILSAAVSLSGLSPLRYLALGSTLYTLVIVATAPTVVGHRYLRLFPLERVLATLGGRFRDLSPMARDTIIQHMQSGVVVLDHRNRIVDLNPMGRRMIGATDSRVVGRPLTDTVSRSAFLTAETSFLDPTVIDGEFAGVWVETDDGERRCFDVSITGLGPDDDPVGRVALITDVTERERRKETLDRRTDELERQNEQLDRFAGIVSHDLRNPLTVAEGYLDAVEGNEDAVAEVEQSLARMEAIVDDVLTLAREGRSLGETERVDLAAVAREAWGNVATDDAELRVDESPSFEGDPDRLLRLFENLFRNAVAHGGTRVTVRVGRTDGGFYVADDGVGIPEDDRSDVLEFGYSTDETGTGFGLAIVTQVAEAHGWTVDVTESDGGGARFEFTEIDRAGSEAAVVPGA